jgi:hypothetical protein
MEYFYFFLQFMTPQFSPFPFFIQKHRRVPQLLPERRPLPEERPGQRGVRLQGTLFRRAL